MAWNDGLIGAALDIAASAESLLRVKAGPGTGKSFALKRRVARLLEEGVTPNQILAVTFTRNAARSLVDDIRSLSIPGSDSIIASTLHSFCFSLLSRNDVLEVSGRVPRPLLTFSSSGILRFEADGLLHDLIHSGGFGPRRECTTRIRAFEAAWARLQSEDPGWPVDPVDRRFETELIDWLRFHEAMLIGEVVPEALRFLRRNPAFIPRFQHVLVDEYQDLNRAEQDLIDVLGSNGSICIVGDVNQSIYSFRHANPPGITDYHLTHPGTIDESLLECRRCPKKVVSLANELISKNYTNATFDPLLQRSNNVDGDVAIVQWKDLEDEVKGLAEFVSHLITAKQIPPGEILILTPRRLIGYQIRDALQNRGIDAHSFYQEEAMEPPEAQYALAVMTLLVNPADRVALRWLLAQGDEDGLADEYADIRKLCEENNQSPWEALNGVEEGSIDIPGVENLLLQFTHVKRELDRIKDKSLEQIIEALIPENSTNMQSLREIAVRSLTESTSIPEIVEFISRELSQPELPEKSQHVRVMSLPKSKGLTAMVTIMTTCNQALIPLIKPNLTIAEKRETREEQRRLFYVGMTRCTHMLVLSSISRFKRAFAHKLGTILPKGGGQYANAIVTQYISELGNLAPSTITGSNWTNSNFRFPN